MWAHNVCASKLIWLCCGCVMNDMFRQTLFNDNWRFNTRRKGDKDIIWGTDRQNREKKRGKNIEEQKWREVRYRMTDAGIRLMSHAHMLTRLTDHLNLLYKLKKNESFCQTYSDTSLLETLLGSCWSDFNQVCFCNSTFH